MEENISVKLQSLIPLPKTKNIKETESSSSFILNSTDGSTSVFIPLFGKLHKLCHELHQDTRKIQETTNSTNDSSSATHYLRTQVTSGDKLVSSSHADFLARTIPNLCPSTSDKAFTVSRHGKTHTSTVTTTMNVPIH